MQTVYLAQEIEEGDVLDVIGIFENYDKALQRCIELFEERGYQYSNDKADDVYCKFYDEYCIEAYIIR